MVRARRRSIHRHWHCHHRVHLADSISRFLHITRRRIPLDRSDDYARLWNNVRAACGGLSANAWIFESAHVAGYFTEFVEWKGADLSLIERGPVADALNELDSVFIAEEAAVWTETTI